MPGGSLDLDDGSLLRAFLECSLSHAQWDHTAHLRVAWMHVRDHGCERAIGLLRARINALNAAHKVPDLPMRGYHETITVAWARILSSRLGADDDSAAFLARNPDLANPRLLQRHYTTELLMSPAAKAAFVEPDLTPLP